ncbi:MAG: enolase C-terminal domain-like protein [Bacteroidota bacterium]|nr:enolase C-terminal domain-like protein [Bacteroidota bacterium]
MEWSIEKLRLNLKYTWKISRNSSAYKENFVVRCKLNGYVGMGEIAPNIRYNETAENIESYFESIHQELQNLNIDYTEVLNFLHTKNIPNALKFGLSAAFTHAFCLNQNIDLHKHLGITKPTEVASCYTLPIMDLADIKSFYQTHHLHRFKQIKIKVDNAAGLDLIKEVQSLGANQIMIDANEAWKDVEELIPFTESIQSLPVLFVEQPMPASFIDEYKHLKKHSKLPIMADESVLAEPNFDEIEQQFHGVNMKLMKAGSYQNGIRILQEAKRRNMICMIGCMIETTLGIKSAWDLCSLADYVDLDGCLIVDNEPYHLLHEEGGTFYEVTK